MSTRAMRSMIGAALAAALAAALVPPEARGQAQEARCSEGQGPLLDLGIASISFSRANLTPLSNRMVWSFYDEPVVVSARVGGPAEGKLERGDRVVSIDGLLITSAEGGRRWSGVGAGRTVTLVVRRGGREREVRIDGSVSCQRLPWLWPERGARPGRSRTFLNPPLDGDTGLAYDRALSEYRLLDRAADRAVDRAAARATDRAADRAADRASSRASARGLRDFARLGRVQARFRLLFGFGLFCASCSFESDSGGVPVLWRFSTPPTVTDVEDGGPAARGGLREGDVLEAVDGAPIASEEGSRRFSTAQPGRQVRFTVRRSGETVMVDVTPESPRPGEALPD